MEQEFAELDNSLNGMLHFREISYDEGEQNLKKFSKGQKIKVKIVEIKDDKIRFSKRALEKDPLDFFVDNNKKIGEIF